MWKSREGKDPPPQFWADFVAATNVVFPAATLGKETLVALYRLAVDEWRAGRQVHVIVRQLCSCDGSTVVPSPAAERRLGKTRGIARPPEKARRGDIFGIDEIRDPAALGRLLGKQALNDARLTKARAKKQTPERQGEIKRLEAEQRDLVAQIDAARSSAFWSRNRPRTGRPKEEPAEPPRPRRARRSPAKETKQEAPPALPPLPPQATTEQAPGFDEDIAADIINALARKA